MPFSVLVTDYCDQAGEVGSIPMIACESFVVVEWTAQPDTSADRPIAGLHIHRSDDEAWYVFEGRLGFRLGDEQREIGPGEWLLATRGTPHSYWNASATPTRYLLVMTPRIHQLIEALHSGERTDYAAIFEEHDSQLL